MLQYQAEEIIDVLTEIRDELRRANEYRRMEAERHYELTTVPAKWEPSWPIFGRD